MGTGEGPTGGEGWKGWRALRMGMQQEKSRLQDEEFLQAASSDSYVERGDEGCSLRLHLRMVLKRGTG